MSASIACMLATFFMSACDCFFCCYEGFLDCYLMNSCSLNSKLQNNLIFPLFMGSGGPKKIFIEKIMGKNIGSRQGSGFGEKYWVSVREFRIFVWVELPHLGSFAACLSS